MKLEKIISVSGKGGLFKMLSQSKGGFIVESLVDGKRFPVQATINISSLEDIAIFTYEKEIPLKDVFLNIAKKENSEPCLSHKEDAKVLEKYFANILPNFDKSRVYNSDIKKIFQWYNILQKAGFIPLIEEEEKDKKAESKGNVKDSE